MVPESKQDRDYMLMSLNNYLQHKSFILYIIL